MPKRPDKREAKIVVKTVTINRSQRDLYQFWRDLRNLPTFMKDIHAVQVRSEKVSHWIMKGPWGRTIEWDIEIVQEKPPELIIWKSLPGSSIENAGSVRFESSRGRGTRVKVALEYILPTGLFASIFASLFHKPDHVLEKNLLCLKALMEENK